MAHRLPREDSEEGGEEGALVIGRPSLSERSPRKLAPRNRDKEPGSCCAVIGIILLLIVAGLVATTAVLWRFDPTLNTGEIPLLIVVSVSTFVPKAHSADIALAWLAGALMDWRPLPVESTTYFSPDGTLQATESEGNTSGTSFIPDGMRVKGWRPAAVANFWNSPQRIHAVTFGPVGPLLQKLYWYEPAQVTNLTVPDDSKEQMFLELERFLQAHGGKTSPLVLVAHPHHLPRLVVVAWAFGFRDIQVIEPKLYSSIPLQMLGCGSVGFDAGIDARELVAKESYMLHNYTAWLEHESPDIFSEISPVVEAAQDATAFHSCMTVQAKFVEPGLALVRCNAQHGHQPM